MQDATNHAESLLPVSGDVESEERHGTSERTYVGFLKTLWKTRGVGRLLIQCSLLSFGYGVQGIVPAITGDRYARIYHGYTGPVCSTNGKGRDAACLLGSNNAQDAVTYSTMVLYGLTFICSPIIGAISDKVGRKVVMIVSVSFYCLGPLMLVVLLLIESMDPVCFFVAQALMGFSSWFVISFATITDLVPPTLRAASLSIVQVSCFLGSPSVPLMAAMFGHFWAAFISFLFVFLGLLFSIFFYPETRQTNNSSTATSDAENTILRMILKPIRELSILNSNCFFRILGVVGFLSGTIVQADRTLLLFYVQGQLEFTDNDVAILIIVHSVVGLCIMTFLLERLTEKIGERHTLIIAMVFGVLHNLLYGLSRSRTLFIIAISCSGITGIGFPVLSSIMSNNVQSHEQGRMQGVVSSVNALANVVGPFCLETIYDMTKDGAFLGPGSMYLVSALFYFVSFFFACALAPELTNSKEISLVERGVQ